MNIKVITCEDTGAKVLFDTSANICLHNDSIIDDLKEVERFNAYTDTYLDYLATNGLDNDYSSISYGDLIDFVENNIGGEGDESN